MEKLIITAAICGAEVTKEHNPAVPYTKEEMVREAKSAYDAGAAVIHVHVRTDDGQPTQDKARFAEILPAIQEACPGAIIIPSTGGATWMTAEERLQPTELFPEMATLDCGTCNFGDDIFVNSMPIMRDFGKRMIENNIKPEYECFEIGHLDTIVNMANKGLVPGAPMQFNFVLGVSGCTPATPENLAFLVNLDRHRRWPRRMAHGRYRYHHGRSRPRWLRGQHLSRARCEGQEQRRAGGEGQGLRQAVRPRDRYPR